jgi:hypothetical protein
MGFFEDYKKRALYGDMTGPARTARESAAFDMADAHHNRRNNYQNNGSSGYQGGIDIEFRFEKKSILRTLLWGIIALCIGGVIHLFMGDTLKFPALGLLFIGSLLMMATVFQVLINLLFSALCGMGTLFQSPLLRRCIKAALGCGIIAVLATGGYASGFIYGAIAGVCLALGYTFYKSRKKT